MSEHWDGCWESEAHPACRLQRIRQLETENYALRMRVFVLECPAAKWTINHTDFQPFTAETAVMPTQSGSILTHPVTIPLHGPGPTWSHCGDEPPCR